MASADTAVRDRIVGEAAARFRRFGVRRTSVESIASAAGIGKGTVYLHFASKEDLYLETVTRAVDSFVSAAETAMARQRGAQRRLRTLVDVAIEHYSRDELLSAPLLDDRDLLTAGVAVQARQRQRERVVALLRDAIEGGRARGEVRADVDAATAAVVLFEAGWAIVRAHLLGELDLPLGTALDSLNDLVGRGTRPVR